MKGPFVEFDVKVIDEKGRAVFTKELIPKGSYVLEYEYNQFYPRCVVFVCVCVCVFVFVYCVCVHLLTMFLFRSERQEHEEEYALNEEGCFIFEVQHPKTGRWYCLDATRTFGTLGRLVNHSSTPNLKAMQALCRGCLRVGFLAMVDIQPNVELSFHYGTQPHPPAFFRRRRIPVQGNTSVG